MSALGHKRTFRSAKRHVRFTPKSRHSRRESHVRFTPESGHVQCKHRCPLWAKSGLMHCSKKVTHSITLSASRRTDSGIFKSIATGLAASLEGFSGSRIGRWRHGEDLEEDAPRYEPVVVDEKAEDEADPEHEDAEQKRVDDGAIGIVVLEARYHHGPQNPGSRPG